MSEIKALAADLHRKRAELADVFTEIKSADVSRKSMLLEEIKRREDDLATIQDRYTQERQIEEAASRNSEELKQLKEVNRSVPFGDETEAQDADANEGFVTPPVGFKSLGQSFIKSVAYKNAKGSGDTNPHIAVDVPGATLNNIKAVLTTATGITPYPIPTTDVVPIARQRPTIADLMPAADTEQPSILYLEQTVATNNMAPVAEGALKPENAYTWVRRTVPLEMIAGLLPITLQELEDVPGIRAIVDQELVTHLRLREEAQLLSGTGVSPQLTGILTRTGIQTQAMAAETRFVALMRAITKVRYTGFADVTGIVMHPNDWVDYAVALDAQGRFLMGNPQDETANRLWGIPVIVTTAITEGTALVGDFATYARVWRKGGIRVEVGYVNDDFAKNQMTIRCEERIALQVRRPSAFCTLTGI